MATGPATPGGWRLPRAVLATDAVLGADAA
jgi:hypothetical protein